MSKLHIKFGELLKLERERQGISLADVSNELKISENALMSVEAGDASSLPSELYFKMFTKSYAEHLGIDYARTVEAIREELGEPLEQNISNGTQSREKQKQSYSSDDESEEEKESATGLPGNVRRLIILVSVIVGAFIMFLLAYQIFSTDETGNGDGVATEMTEAESTAEEVNADTDQTASNHDAYNWDDVPTYQPPDSIRLTLVAQQDSWATVLVDGDTVIYQTLTPGRRYTLTAKYRFLVSIGVPRVVDAIIDGQPAYLASVESGRISRVEINQTNRDEFRSPPKPPTPTVTIPTSLPDASSTEDIDSTQQGDSDSI
ncbi:MAG: DUF4115 domain-containing protein [candidate division Zixibacteria bacterium]|nr:DUF4115 domain-containing protein [candidate division Zixibacteria bacterium]